jgi:hypothetical protein
MTMNRFMQILAVGIWLGMTALDSTIAKTAGPGEPPAVDRLTGLADELTAFYLEVFEWQQESDTTAQHATDEMDGS